jgi:hypothetical protein
MIKFTIINYAYCQTISFDTWFNVNQCKSFSYDQRSITNMWSKSCKI